MYREGRWLVAGLPKPHRSYLAPDSAATSPHLEDRSGSVELRPVGARTLSRTSCGTDAPCAWAAARTRSSSADEAGSDVASTRVM